MIAMKSIFMAMAVLSFGLLTGCGNSDGSVSLNESQTAGLVQSLGTFEGPAHAEEIMGAMMTGVWKVTFFQDDTDALKCKCSLQLHDEQNGWGNPEITTTDVKVFKGSADGLYDLKAEGSFSDTEPKWFVGVDGVSLALGGSIGTITLIDMDSNQITLSRK
jgi:hypothetical protein